jgi:hypothetical protein
MPTTRQYRCCLHVFDGNQVATVVTHQTAPGAHNPHVDDFHVTTALCMRCSGLVVAALQSVESKNAIASERAKEVK